MAHKRWDSENRTRAGYGHGLRAGTPRMTLAPPLVAVGPNAQPKIGRRWLRIHEVDRSRRHKRDCRSSPRNRASRLTARPRAQIRGTSDWRRRADACELHCAIGRRERRRKNASYDRSVAALVSFQTLSLIVIDY